MFAAVLACFTQPAAVAAFVDRPDAGPLQTSIIAIYSVLANGFVSDTGNATIDALFSRGGMDSMLYTIWLVLGALSFAAIMEDAGFLERLIRPVLARATSTGRLIASVIATCIGLNIIAGDQYVAIVMPSRIYRLEFARRGIAPRMLSRAVEDSGTVTSPLVPWNSCGAYMAGVLGVATIAYLPYCFFNLGEPADLAGVRVQRVPDRAHRTARRDARLGDDRASPGSTARWRSAMTTAETPGAPAKRGFALPSAYTILFILIVAGRRPDMDHPGRPVRRRQQRRTDPGLVPHGPAEPAADRRRFAPGADQRSVRHRGRDGQRQRLEQR